MSDAGPRAQPREAVRESVLDAMRQELQSKDWSAITLSDIARTAGVSRQTIYNEFGSRQGLAQGYALRLADRLVDGIHTAINSNIGDFYGAFLDGFRAFFRAAAADPLVVSLLSGEAKPDLLQIITIDSGSIISRGSQRLTSVLMDSWVDADPADLGVLARAIVRLAMSYVAMPPEHVTEGVPGPDPDAVSTDVAVDLARLMTPFAQRYAAGNPDAVIRAPSG